MKLCRLAGHVALAMARGEPPVLMTRARLASHSSGQGGFAFFPSSTNMQKEVVPAPKFRRFEKVLLIGDGTVFELSDQQGVVIWGDHTRFSAYDQGFKKPPRRWSEWVYCVHLPCRDYYCSLRESQLRSAGDFDSEKNHIGVRFEISFDTVPVEDAHIVEGCYRLPGRFWEVFVFIKVDVAELRHDLVVWPSGVAGIQFDVPQSDILNREYIMRAMSDAFAAGPCIVVHGPDSLLLK